MISASPVSSEARKLEFGTADAVSQPSVAIDDYAISELVGPLSASACDLIELVAAIDEVDRLVGRPDGSRTQALSTWERQLELVIGVRQPDFWNSEPLVGALHGLLRWLTEDTWHIRFVERKGPPRRGERPKDRLFRLDEEVPSNADTVALYSGGLDSYAGLTGDFARGARPILVSVSTNNRMTSFQRKSFSALLNASGSRVHRLSVKVRFSMIDGDYRHLEESHRSRGLLFLSLAAVVAAARGISSVTAYENGIGAINLPITAAQVGVRATRSMHPRTLAMAADLFSTVFDRRIDVRNPNLLRTKARMCRDVGAEQLAGVSETRSCDTAASSRLRHAGLFQCGACTSCLLRRHALHSAGLAPIDWADSYRFDAFANPLANESYPLRAMLTQASHIRRCLTSPQPWRSFVSDFPEVDSACRALPGQDLVTRDSLMSMYRSYSDDWLALPVPGVEKYFVQDLTNPAA